MTKLNLVILGSIAGYLLGMSQVYDLSWWLFPEPYADADARSLFRWICYGSLIIAQIGLILWAVVLFCQKQHYRRFTLKDVSTRQGHGMAAYNEWFTIDEDPGFEFPSDHATEFWINLEDTDDGREVMAGSVYQVKPVYHKTLNNVTLSSHDDLVHVKVNKDGHVTAKFVTGNQAIVGYVNFDVTESYQK